GTWTVPHKSVRCDMKTSTRIAAGCLCLLLIAATLHHVATAAEKDSENPAVSEAAKPFRLGDLLEPFNPPPLAELDKTAGWIDQPVLSGMEVMRKKQAAQGPPPVSVADVLALRNDSPGNNAKIRDALGRVAPANGAGVDYDTTFVRHAGGDLKSSNP